MMKLARPPRELLPSEDRNLAPNGVLGLVVFQSFASDDTTLSDNMYIGDDKCGLEEN
jgi:hypothetical protein